jgi:hypothetical protein
MSNSITITTTTTTTTTTILLSLLIALMLNTHMVYDSGSCRWQVARQVWPPGGIRYSKGYTLVVIREGEEPSRAEAINRATGTFWQVAKETADQGGPYTLRWNVWLHDGAEW